ncbi:DUF1294 domain-containing protein [Porphyrobacter sp. ULC335]|uniref:DUF1294 domain-containing protein n=1 Tax=Porphyrobacter sp. ULC335 TaxID=2854260 RepID=UPI0024CC2D47|nr:DUF1294 domain-containing protein [Porphyrobacter sp. ULC335]
MDPHALVTDPSTIAAVKALVTPFNIAAALLAMNLFAFAAFGIDKARAAQGAWRVSESTLLRLAFFGGTVGAYAGRALFRHKTRKQPFCGQLHAIAALQLAAAAGLAVYFW